MDVSRSLNTAACSTSTLYGRRKLKEEAEAEIFQQSTEAAALEHLWKTKPAYLCSDGGDLWIDHKHVDEKIANINLMFKVNSFPERAERFMYLQSTLKQKWANKPDVYRSMMTFLAEMVDRPAQNLNLKVGTTKYSTDVEPDIDSAEMVLYGEELRQLEMKKQAFRQEVVDDLLEARVELSYSSEEELSDWGESSSSEDEEEDAGTTNKVASPVVLPKPVAKPTEAEKKKAIKNVWDIEQHRSISSLTSHLRRVEPARLMDQPVISSLVTLNTRFGEHWEWKKTSSLHQRPSKLAITENDIIRELIWQFTVPSNQDSHIFTSEWVLRPELIVKSLSNSSLHTFVSDCGKVLARLQYMRKFIHSCTVVDSYPPIYRTYAHALSQVLTFITQKLDEIERSLKIETNSSTATECCRPPSTLIQFRSAISPTMDLITQLELLHSQAVCISDSLPNWLKALKLISSLETRLGVDANLPLYGLILFIFTQCLHSALELVLKPLELKNWDSNEYLFSKSAVKLTDPNFWNEVVTLHPLEEELQKLCLRPLSFLIWVLPKIHTMLKVQEILNQLDTDGEFSYKEMLKPLPSTRAIVYKFLDLLMEGNSESTASCAQPPSVDESQFRKDFELHLHYLGLKDSVMSGAFQSILSLNGEDRLPQTPRKADYDGVQPFYNIKSIPLLQTRHPLEKLMQDEFGPYFEFGQISLCKMFEEYEVREAILLLQDVIFGGKEEFALASIRLAYETRSLELHNGRVDDEEDPNMKFQNLLNYLYPEGRSTFEIEFIYQSKSATSFDLKIQPLFPLTLFLTTKTIGNYEHVSREIFKIRKGLWLLNRLRPKECKAGIGVELYRILLVRFSMVQFWCSLRSFVLITALNNNEIPVFNQSSSIDEMLKVYENESSGLLYRVLSFKFFDSIIIKPMLYSTMVLSKNWKTGISLIELSKLCGRVHAAWEMTLQLGKANHSPEMNQIAQFFGPVPEILE